MESEVAWIELRTHFANTGDVANVRVIPIAFPVSRAPTRRLPSMLKILATIVGAAAFAAVAQAQVNYPTEAFNASAAGWTVTGGYLPQWNGAMSVCSGGHLRTNLYVPGTQGNFTSPLLGTSTGGSTTLTFDYRIHGYVSDTAIGPPSTPPFGTTNVQIGATATGPWTTVATFGNEAQTSACITKTITFTPPAGALYVRLNNVYSAGDNWWCFDNISAVEATGGCSGTPAPGNTTGPASPVCPGQSFTLGLQNSTSGTGVTYQWFASTVGATGPWTPVSTSATFGTTQTVDTWYYCAVTCGGSATGNSSVLAVPMAAAVAAFPRDFEGGCGGISAAGWSVSGTNLPFLAPVSAFGAGSNSAKFDFWNWNAGTSAILTSPTFPATGVGTKCFFDVAGTQYLPDLTLIDQITLEASNDGGVTWAPVAVMNNAATGVLRTAAPVSPNWVPTANDWASLDYVLPAGTNQIRFNALCGFGNTVVLDNISVGILPSSRHTKYGATCQAGFALSASPAPVAGVTYAYNQAGIPLAATGSGIYFGVMVLSFGQNFVGTPLNVLTGGIVDSPCNLHVASVDATLSFVSVTPTDSSVTLAVPAGISGVLLYAQSAALVTPVAPNNAGIVTSNAVRTFINTF